MASNVTLGGITGGDMLDLVTKKAQEDFARMQPKVSKYPGMLDVVGVAAGLGARAMFEELSKRGLIMVRP